MQQPENDLDFVRTSQILVAQAKIGHLKVTIYFMANTALEISGGIAKTAMGKVTLQYTAVSANEAIAASQNLRKVVFTFLNPQGMASNFEFNGQKT